MKEATRNALVGLFVLASLTVFASLMVMFGEAPSWLGGDEWQLKVTNAKEIRGVGDGSPVYLNGVEIGRVARLVFNNPERPDRGVNIIANIKRRYVVPIGAVAKVYSPTLGFGTGRLEIIVDPQGDLTPVPQDGGQIPGVSTSMLGEIVSPQLVGAVERMITNMGELAGKAVPVAEALEDLLEQRHVEQVDTSETFTANLSTVVERLDVLVANFNKVLGDEDVQGDLKGMANDLKASSEELRSLVGLWREESEAVADNVNQGIDRTDDNLNVAIARLIEVIDNLDDSTKSLAQVLQGVAEGKGTAGLLVTDPRLYEAVNLSFERFAELLDSLLRITGKIERDGYITIGQETVVGTITKDFPVGEEEGGK